MLTISGDVSIRNNFLYGSTNLVNIQKEKSVLKYNTTYFPFSYIFLKDVLLLLGQWICGCSLHFGKMNKFSQLGLLTHTIF